MPVAKRTAFNTNWNDAGELREYAAQKYGHVYARGGYWRTYRQAMGIARRLSRMTGLDVVEVVRALAEDFQDL